jgi:putative DNA primase/helicase
MGYALEELGADRCAQIAAGLFKVEKVYGEKLHGFCPIHGDKASASFVYVPSGDWYKCQSCGAGGDLVKLWCHVHGLDSHGDGFKRFKEEFVGDSGARTGRRSPATGQNSRPPLRLVEPAKVEALEVFVPEADLAALPPLPAERCTELRRVRGWSESVIRQLDLRQFDDGRGNQKIAIPIRDAEGRLGNIRLYQPGAAQFKVISWYDQKCQACGGSWKVVEKKKTCQSCGGAPNDYGRTRLFPSPAAWKRDGLLWLCEGEPDTICALSQGLNAVTQTAGCGTWREEFSLAMAGRDVVICYDADKAGWKGSFTAAESLALHAKSVRVLRWPEMMGAA